MYLWRTLRLHERDGILLPYTSQILLKLLLSRTYPRRVVALGDPHALMSEKQGDTLQWNPGEEQFDGKRVAEPVSATARNVS
jgi:hypothetical protein